MPDETEKQTPHALLQRFLPQGAFTTKQKAMGGFALLAIIAVVVAFSGSSGNPNSQTTTDRKAAATPPAPVPLQRIQESAEAMRTDADRIRQAHDQLLQAQRTGVLAAQAQAADEERAQAALRDATAQRAAFQQHYGTAATPVQTASQVHASPIGRIGFEAAASTVRAPEEPATNRQEDAKSALREETKERSPLDFDPDLPQLWLPEGTVIETVLTDRLAGENNGPVNVMTTTPTYAPGTYTVVIPQGARFLGQGSAVNAFGQQRLAVSFHRILVQKGTKVYSIPLDKDKVPGLDQEGAAALHDKVNGHYPSIFGASLAIGAIGGLANIGSGYGGNGGYSSLSQFRGGISQGMSQSSERVLDRFLNRMPTITIREGTRVKIMLTGDVPAPAY